MNQNNHRHIYQARDTDRLIAQYGNKPDQNVRKNIRLQLDQQRERFKRMERFKAQEQSRGVGRWTEIVALSKQEF